MKIAGVAKVDLDILPEFIDGLLDTFHNINFSLQKTFASTVTTIIMDFETENAESVDFSDIRYLADQITKFSVEYEVEIHLAR